MNKIRLFLAVFLIGTSAMAQDRPMHEVYSMMLFNFTRYVQWPDHENTGEFVIAVIGNNDVYNTLNSWYGGKPKGSKTFVVKKVNSAAELANCHLVFIDKSKSSEFEAVSGKLKGKGALIITDRHGLAEKGSAINFRTIDNKLRFELNQKVLETNNLKVSTALTSMAILI